MQFEVIRKNHKKEIIIGVIAIILIAIVLIVGRSYAKYQITKNMTILSGTINYTVPDFKIMAMYQQKEGSSCTENDCYEEISGRMPTSGYEINESKSYCMIDNIKDTQAKLFTSEEGIHSFSNLEKNEKCYIYFNKKSLGYNQILANLTIKVSAESFKKTATTNEGLFKSQDDDGDTYYYRGAVTNNYVKFANKYWRIIRINGDNSIRIIYDGDTYRANGSSLTVETSKFNENYNNNMYVGFKYSSDQVHGIGNNSNVLNILDTWYNNYLSSYRSKIDINAGFCNDREPSTNGTSNGLGGTGTTGTYYGAYLRLKNEYGGWNTNIMPTFKCQNTSDLFTVSGSSKGNKALVNPIGLITVDEVVFAGGYSTENTSYYLYTGQDYWTMSPSKYPNALEFYVK